WLSCPTNSHARPNTWRISSSKTAGSTYTSRCSRSSCARCANGAPALSMTMGKFSATLVGRPIGHTHSQDPGMRLQSNPAQAKMIEGAVEVVSSEEVLDIAFDAEPVAIHAQPQIDHGECGRHVGKIRQPLQRCRHRIEVA